MLFLQRPPEGYNVAVHHTWSAEVESYRTHHWKVRAVDNHSPSLCSAAACCEGITIQSAALMLVTMSLRTRRWSPRSPNALQCERCDDLVKRSMNRPPQEADCRGRQGRGGDCADPHCRYHVHQKTCGGAYVKVCAAAGRSEAIC